MKSQLTFKHLTPLSGTVAGFCASLALFIVPAQAGEGEKRALDVSGYEAVSNRVFFDASQPGFLQVQFDGVGGFAHLGKLRARSTDQRVNLATGVQDGHVTFEDQGGNTFVASFSSPTVQQPDGRITFEGPLSIVRGTGRFASASGNLTFNGWARTTDFVTGEGIGFFTVDGVIEGINIRPHKPFTSLDKGVGTIIHGTDFVYDGGGVASRIGRFTDHAASIPSGPFHSAFVGIVDGRFVIASAYKATWTTSNGDTLELDGLEFIHFALGPDGGPDFSQPSTPYPFYTVTGGSGRFANAEGVIFAHGQFTPTGPTTVNSEIYGSGYLSK